MAITHLGIGTYAYAWNIAEGRMDGRGLIARAIELDAEVVQFCENLPLGSAEIEAARQAGLYLELGTRGLNSSRLEESIEIAAEIGSPFLRLVIDTPGDEPSGDEIVARLAPHVAHARERGILIAIENHDRIPVKELAAIVRELGATICLDTANSLGSLEGPNEAVQALAPYTVCLHVKDVRARRMPHQMGFVVEGVAAGTGSLDIGGMMDRLDGAGAVYSVILESWPPSTGVPPLELEVQMAAEGFGFLRDLIRMRREVAAGA